MYWAAGRRPVRWNDDITGKKRHSSFITAVGGHDPTQRTSVTWQGRGGWRQPGALRSGCGMLLPCVLLAAAFAHRRPPAAAVTPRLGKGPACSASPAQTPSSSPASKAVDALTRGEPPPVIVSTSMLLPRRLSMATACFAFTRGCCACLASEAVYTRAPRAVVGHLRSSNWTQPDAAVAHLATADAARRGKFTEALTLLASLHADDGIALTSGSFDLIIQGAARKRDRETAYRAYRLLRRCRLTPTAYTLNALLHAETRCGRPGMALRLLERAEKGAPRWRGGMPDSWSYTSAMVAADAAGEFEYVGKLFARLTSEEHLRSTVQAPAFNYAIAARLRLHDRKGALHILHRMVEGSAGSSPTPSTRRKGAGRQRRRGGPADSAPDGASIGGGYVPVAVPEPRVGTFNMMIATLGDMGEPYAWVLREMAAARVQPDTITVCTMLKLQPSLRLTRAVWRWGRKVDAVHGLRAWHHLIEAHVRFGQPERAAALFALMEARDHIRPTTAYSHNLYLRALLADNRPHAALDHFERMCERREGDDEASSAPEPFVSGETSTSESASQPPSPLPPAAAAAGL